MRTLSSKTIPRTPGSTDNEQLPSIAQSEMLQVALTGLDVSLDEELDRYRHWQENGQSFSYLNPFKPLTSSVKEKVILPEQAREDIALLPNVPPATPRSAQSVSSRPSSTGIDGDRVRQDAVWAAIQSDVKIDRKVEPSYKEVREEQAANFFNDEAGISNEENTDIFSEDDLLQQIANSYSEEEDYEENTFDRAPEVNLFEIVKSPVGVASLLGLLLTSAIVGYLLVDSSAFTRLFQPNTKPKSPTSYLQDPAEDINLQSKQNPVDPDSLLANPKNTNVVPFVPLPGKDTQPGQSLESFTSKLPQKVSPFPSVTSLAPKNYNDPLPVLTSPIKELPPAPSSYPSLPSFSAPGPTYSAPEPTYYEPSPRPRSTNRYNASPVLGGSRPVSSNLRDVPNATPSVLSPAPTPAPSTLKPIETAAVRTPRSFERPSVIDRLPKSENPVVPDRLPKSESPAVPYRPPAPPVQYAAPMTVTPAAAPAPSTPPVQYAAPLSASPASTSSSRNYKVTVDNTYLSKAQQLDKEAFVRPNDGKLQLGAYNDATIARQRVEELRRKGIPARVDRL